LIFRFKILNHVYFVYFNRVIDDEAIEKTKEEVNTLLNSSEDDKKRLDALWEGIN